MIPAARFDSSFFSDHNIPSAYLLSIDLEDIRTQSPFGTKFPSRVAMLVERFLGFFEKHEIQVTFFTVGHTARKNPDTIRRIVAAGHEVACHTYDHKPLDKSSAEKLKENLKRNKNVLIDLGAEQVTGFRAPDFSLIEDTQWGWDVLAELGFRYSSSVLPARNPLYGWRGYSRIPVYLPQGIWSFPISVTPTPGMQIPFAGGVYLRLMPKAAILSFSRWYSRRSYPLVGYLHPYDIDRKQERFRIEQNYFYNKLIYYNRKSVFTKAEALLKRFPGMTFSKYIEKIEAAMRRDN